MAYHKSNTSEMPVGSLPANFAGGSLFYQYLATFTAILALVSSGMHFGWPSPSLPILLNESSHTGMTQSDGSWLAVMPSTGAAFGAVVGGSLVDFIGRKPCILLLSPVYFVTWLTIAFVPTMISLYIARFIVGVADGIAFTVFPMYICEISDSKVRGMLASTIQMAIMLGFLLINGIGINLPIKQTAVISATIPVLNFLTFIWMPESPYYLILKSKSDKAISSLKTLKQKNNVDDEVARLSRAIEEDRRSSESLLDLWTVGSNRNALLVVCILRFLQQLCGNFPIAMYCQMIFLEAGGSVTAGTASLIYFSGQLVVAIISSFLIDRTGRKPLLIASAIGSGIALAVEGVYFYLRSETITDLSHYSFVPLAALLLYMVMYSIGLNTIPTVLLGEVFPTSIRAFALCVADIVFSLSVAVVSKYFQITKDKLGMYVPFFSFAVGCAILLVFVVYRVPETKGKTLEEVQVMFGGTNKNK